MLGGAAIGLAMLPAGAVAYTAAAIDNRSMRPFYSHERTDASGRTITLSKLRTLKPELVTDAIGRGTNDPRASGIGRLLRRYGLDEIPQLQNVLEGDMSLIGIRPSSEAQLEYLEDRAPQIFPEWYEAYEAGLPALIGPSQIFRRKFKSEADEDIDQYLRMDIEYVKNASFFSDLRFLGSAPLKLLAANIMPVPAGQPSPMEAGAVGTSAI